MKKRSGRVRGPGALEVFLPALLGGILLLGQGCSTQGVAVQEYDSLLLPPENSSPYAPLAYGNYSLRYPWIYRQFEGTGIDWFFINVFGVDPSPHHVRRPLLYARERLRVMGRAVFPREIREAALRLMLAAIQDPWRLNRVTALESLKELALRVGPGEAPPPEVSKDPPRPPSLDRAFRARLARESARGEWKTFRKALARTFLAALTDPRQVVRAQALQGAYDLWGVKGLRTAILVHQRWGPPVWSPMVVRKAVYLCQGALPEDARDRKGGPSLFDVLHQWLSRIPTPWLVLDCRKAIASILGVPPRHDASFYEKWWEEETRGEHGSPGGKGGGGQ